ncbi:MAG: ketoacyl-ACP synthase III [Candidatus Aminicenantes bacterium]|nr:ketoacyl-ACP synthase III [Candidatus Aminicenantes bacterium]
MGVVVKGLGASLPEKILTNQDLEKMVDTSDEWITTRTGIKTRRISKKDEPSSKFAIEAGRMAIEDAGMKPSDIDVVIVATVTPDMMFPSTGCIVASELGMGETPAFDISAGCSGFLYAMNIADSFIRAGKYSTALIIGVEELSKITDWTDRSTCVLFGDGAGAAVLTRSEEEGILSIEIRSDGSKGELLYMPAGGSRMPASEYTVKNRLHYVKMNGREVFKYAVTKMPAISKEALEKAGVSVDQVDLFIPHQANQRITESTGERLGIDPSRVFSNIAKYGNTSAASIPIAWWEAYKEGKIKEGDIILLAAFGAGFTWGAAVVKWRRK